MTEPALKARHCKWIAIPGAADARGRINFLELGKGLDFQPVRLFWLHHVAPGQWRGRHGHRESKLLFVALNGSCRAHLDDGRMKESVTLDDPARALYIAPWVWHELTDFAPGSVDPWAMLQARGQVASTAWSDSKNIYALVTNEGSPAVQRLI